MSRGMITGKPVLIRDAQVTASTIPYPDTGETLLTDSTSYVVNDTVSYLIDNLYHKFVCKTAHTSDFADITKTPVTYPDDAANQYWIDLGAVNKFAPFQYTRSARASTASPYNVDVTPGERVTEIGIFFMSADEVTLTVYDNGSNVIHTEVRSLLQRTVNSYWTYFTAPIRQISRTLFDFLPMHSDNKFSLSFTRQTGNVEVGAIIAIRAVDIGHPAYGADVVRENFSKFDRDEFTNVKIAKKRNIPMQKLELTVGKGSINTVTDVIDDLNAQVTMWSGVVERTDGYFESLFSIGLYREFTHTIDNYNQATAKIEIMEL